MSTFNLINIFLSVFCAVVCITCFFIVVTDESVKGKRSRIYLSLIFTLFVMLLSDAAANGLQGRTGINPYLMIRVLSIAYICGPVMLIFLTRLIIVIIEEKTVVSKAAVYASYAAIGTCILDIGLIAASQFIPLYFWVDEHNRLIRHHNWNIFTQTMAFVCMLIDLGILIAHKKYLSKREYITMIAQIVIPISSVLIFIFFVDLSVVNFAVTIAVLLYFGNIQSELRAKIKQKELELIKNRIEIMVSQIQPHFIYNSLSVIKHLCDTDPQKAKETVVEFSSYLRSNLDSLAQNRLILFEKELSHTETYLKIEKKRFDDFLNIVYDIKTINFMLPVLTLQPIVENAVKHGISTRNDGGTVTIRTEETANDYLITVTDDGTGFDNASFEFEKERSHIGIDNVRNRLAAMCNGKLETDSKPGYGTTVIITIPKK
ncbi:MAG: histidine kinase [Treponema sp.]|nr:histidine kinase [Treponema sp.]